MPTTLTTGRARTPAAPVHERPKSGAPFRGHCRTLADAVFDVNSGSRTFTRNDLNQILAEIADREPDLRLAA